MQPTAANAFELGAGPVSVALEEHMSWEGLSIPEENLQSSLGYVTSGLPGQVSRQVSPMDYESPEDRSTTTRPAAPANLQEPAHRASVRDTSTFNVGQLLNRFKYGDEFLLPESHCQREKSAWCPAPPPPCSQVRGVGIPTTETAEVECVVCMEPIRPGQEVSSLLCQHVYHFECIQSWFVQELNTNSMATCPQCKATVFDARHLRASFDVPPTTAERSPIDVLLHVGEEFTECHRRGGRVLMGFMCLLIAFGIGCCFWVGISQATGAAQ